MPQTLLALLALVLSSLLVFNQQRLTLRSQTNMVTDEAELAAAGLASEVIEFVGARSFDEESTPYAIYRSGEIPESPSAFSNASTFGAADRGTDGCNLLAPAATRECDDVDDVDGLGWTPVRVPLAGGRWLGFDVRTQVYYVDNTESMEPAGAPTLHKRVVMDIRSDHVVGDEADGLLRVTRVISYDPVKAAMDYENDEIYGPNGTIGGGGSGGVTDETS